MTREEYKKIARMKKQMLRKREAKFLARHFIKNLMIASAGAVLYNINMMKVSLYDEVVATIGMFCTILWLLWYSDHCWYQSLQEKKDAKRRAAAEQAQESA